MSTAHWEAARRHLVQQADAAAEAWGDLARDKPDEPVRAGMSQAFGDLARRLEAMKPPPAPPEPIPGQTTLEDHL